MSQENWAIVRAVMEEYMQPAGHTDLCGLLLTNKLLTRVRNCQMSTTTFLAFLCSLANYPVFISFQKQVSSRPCFSCGFDYIRRTVTLKRTVSYCFPRYPPDVLSCLPKQAFSEASRSFHGVDRCKDFENLC